MNQTFVSIPIEEWQRVVSILERIEDKITPNTQDEWIGTDEACEMLHVTKNTWLAYRKKIQHQDNADGAQGSCAEV